MYWSHPSLFWMKCQSSSRLRTNDGTCNCPDMKCHAYDNLCTSLHFIAQCSMCVWRMHVWIVIKHNVSFLILNKHTFVISIKNIYLDWKQPYSKKIRWLGTLRKKVWKHWCWGLVVDLCRWSHPSSGRYEHGHHQRMWKIST